MNKVILLFFIFCSSSAISITQASDRGELVKKLQEMLSEQKDINDEQKNQLIPQVLSIMATKNKFDYQAIKEPCKGDLERYCSEAASVSESINCIKANRESASRICEDSLKNRFGGKSFPEDKMYAGVLIPKGSHFFYDPSGNILGAIASQDFMYRGIKYKKGQIRLHETGLSFAHLTEDQLIDGTKYMADGIGPFFNKDGYVENATLAEDTQIGGVLYKGGTPIQFYTKGQVKSGTVAEKIEVLGKSYEAGKPIWFKKDGSLSNF